MANVCPRCKSANAETQRFCGSCGQSLDAVARAASQIPGIVTADPATPSRPASTETVRDVRVKEYRNAQEFEQDAQVMTRQGWRIEGNTQTEGHVNVGRTVTGAVLTGGLSLLLGGSRTKGKITITWIRDRPRGQVPAD